MTENTYYATGRRKTSIARTYLSPGSGQITVNNRPLDDYFNTIGIPISEAGVEAYMRDALFRGAGDQESVLARILGGRTLVFRSLDDQEEFHDLWSVLWDELSQLYCRSDDTYGSLRSELLVLNDRCSRLVHGLDANSAEQQQAMAQNPALADFGMLVVTLSGLLSSICPR